MASFYKRGNIYWICYKKPDGTWSDKSTGIKVSAKGSGRRIERLVARQQASERVFSKEAGDALFASWVGSWMDYKYDNELTRSRCAASWSHLSEFLRKLKVTHPAEVTYQMCHNYMEWRTDQELAAKENRRSGKWNTALTEIRFLGAILQEAVRRGYIIANPCSQLGLGRKNTKEKREITSEEIERINDLIVDAPEWMQDSWLVAIKQGCRLRECAVHIDNIDLGVMSIRFHVKGGKTHTAPLHKDLLPLIEKAKKRESKKIVDFGKYPSKCWSQWFAKNGFGGITFHCTRVTVITRLARAGFSEAKCMQYVGHSSEEVHAIYRKLKSADVAELGDVL